MRVRIEHLGEADTEYCGAKIAKKKQCQMGKVESKRGIMGDVFWAFEENQRRVAFIGINAQDLKKYGKRSKHLDQVPRWSIVKYKI